MILMIFHGLTILLAFCLKLQKCRLADQIALITPHYQTARAQMIRDDFPTLLNCSGSESERAGHSDCFTCFARFIANVNLA